jgi:BNR repeat protein
LRFPRFVISKPLSGAAVLLFASAMTALAASADFSPQTRLGYMAGDQWEPAIAADGYGDVYLLYPQYGEAPGCASCSQPAMMLEVSVDNGASWQAPRELRPSPSGQFDAQIVVDPLDRRTIYASWLQNGRTDVVVARSRDFGSTWSIVVAASANSELDKPILAARGRDVYVGFNHGQKLWVSSSHDGGSSFTSTNVNPDARRGWALAGGATVDPAGNVYFSWVEYSKNGGAKPVRLYVSKSSDGGQAWSTTLLDFSAAPPDCAAFECGGGYLGAQITMASDEAGTLYALWNAGNRNRAPERIYFSSSTTAGSTWSPRFDVSSAARGVEHGFPAITAGAAGDVRIAWMDTRNQPLWNTYYRSSTNGGATWSPESRLSSYVPGYKYIQRGGFNFPFGDYFGIAIDSRGQTHAAWGEGWNYQTPGSIWYANGR